ncbi:MAG: right-handed parallel beta-helix repeat-containing protein, partial [Candidatus Sumerlaeia bacterium]|nr:right-handed parallel beta-helix repeat-containing protein [Candidatus Sumerlaeia bacterium]
MNELKIINRLILLIICLMLLWNSVPALDYYVSAFWGSDATGDGSTTAPWATIQYAINRAVVTPPYPTNIRVDLGTYTENLVLRNNIHLYGGYNSQLGWQRDVKRFISKIKAASATAGARTVYLKSDTRLDGFTISDGFFGVYCDANVPMTIFNNVIENHLHYGIVTLNGAQPLIEKNVLRNNKGGVLCVTNAGPLIIENTINSNSCLLYTS